MRIDKIEIDAFGGLTGFSLELGEGFQVLLGGNEEGKTTLMSFLKMMFYSKVARSRSLEHNLRKKYAPWDGSPMGGAVEFCVGKRRYRLQKSFGDTPAKDMMLLLDLAAGEPVPLGRDEEVGKWAFDLDLESFERSCFIGRVGRIPPPGGADDVARRLLSNLADSGQEELSSRTVLDNLQEAREELISKNGKKGLLVEARERLEEKKREKQQGLAQMREQEETLAQCRALEGQLEEAKALEGKLAALAAQQQLGRLDELLVKAGTMDTLAAQLARPGMELAQIPAFLAELEEKKQALQSAYGTYTGLAQREPAALEDLMEEGDYHRALALEERAAAGRGLKTALESALLPAAAVCREKSALEKAAGEKTLAAEQSAKALEAREREDMALAAREGERAGELAALQTELEGMQPLWEARMALAAKGVETAQNAGTGLLERPGGGAGRWVLALLIGGAVLAAYYVTNYLPVLAGFALALLPVVAGGLLAGRRQEKAGLQVQRGLAEALQTHLETEKQIALERQGFQEKMDALLGELQEISADRQALAGELEQLARTREALAQAQREQTRAQLALEEALASYQRQENYLGPALAAARAAGVEFPELPDPQQPDAAALLDQLDDGQRKTIRELQGLLDKYTCISTEALREKWMRQQAETGSRQVLAQTRGSMEQARRELCDACSRYEPVENLQQAQEVLDKLGERWHRYRELEAWVKSTAGGMGLASADTGHLLGERSRLAELAHRWDTAGLEEEPLRQALDRLRREDPAPRLAALQARLRFPERAPDEIEAEMEELRGSIAHMEERYDHLGLALELMSRAAEEMRQSFGPRLNESTGEILAQLTGGRYRQVLVTKDYEVRVRQGNHFREHEFLSDGAVDQVYLALRLALSRMISQREDPLPLVLDDVLMQYDDHRARRCLRYLAGLCTMEGMQMLLFTCHGHIAALAREIPAPVLPLRAEAPV